MKHLFSFSRKKQYIETIFYFPAQKIQHNGILTFCINCSTCSGDTFSPFFSPSIKHWYNNFFLLSCKAKILKFPDTFLSETRLHKIWGKINQIL